MQNLALPYFFNFIDPKDLTEIASRVREINPEIRTIVANIERNDSVLLKKMASAPLLTVEFCRTRGFEPPRGPWLRSLPVNKAAQLRIVESAGLSVPFWKRYERGLRVSEDDFGPYVFVKSTLEGKSNGNGNVLIRTRDFDRVKPVLDANYTGIGAPTAIVQKFIDTGPLPTHHRVLLFFGKPIVSRLNRSNGLSAVYTPAQPLFAKDNIASNRGERSNMLHKEDDVLQFASAIAGLFPDKPIIGMDIIRSEADGKLYFLEANVGNVWVFSTQSAQEQRSQLGGVEAIKAQFGAFDVCAAALAEKVRELAA